MLLRTSTSSATGGAALPELHRRLKWVALTGVIAFLLLACRLWQLQIMRGESYRERTVSNVVKERYLPSVRGKILDRKGVPLADNRPAFNIYATPKLMTDAVKADLVRMLNLSDDEVAKLDERLEVGRKRDRTVPVLVLEDKGRDAAALVEQAESRLPGVEVHHEPYRFYPQGDLAAHIIGYMTQMTAGEVEKLGQTGYDASELVGRYGIEKEQEYYLRGKKGFERFAVDARGQLLDDATTEALIGENERLEPPTPGANIVLTLDAELQKLAEKAVGHRAAALAVIEVKTGKVLAIVSKPSFDPNVMTGHLTKQEETLLYSDPRKPMFDKALKATYPPGSIFKFATALAALEDGQAAEDESMFCTGEYVLSGTTFRCHGTHGKIDLLGAIQHSCDTYFWKLAERVGIDRISQVATEYGLGTRTSIGVNADADGRVPTKAWYEAHGGYKVGFATNEAIGQGDVEVTVIQMAMAYAAIANNGTLFVPQIIERIERSDGHLIKKIEPVSRTVKTPADALDIWKRGMWKVTNEPGGTAYIHGHSDIVTIDGKTGTAEVMKHHRTVDEAEDRWNPKAAHAWFAGWAPADDPEIAIVVMIEHGGGGGAAAWPIAKQIFDGYFTKIHPIAKATP
ncbi:MAG TPA: penicillin-binding protein 2 [Kofleriaceae bacterium]|jgi:penicillin-binding protein 2